MNVKHLIPALVLILAFSVNSSQSHAQKIIKWSQYKIIKDKWENTKIQIRSLARKGNTDAKYNNSFGVYGVVICYTVNGKKKGVRKDMTYNLKNKGKYEMTLGYGSVSRVGGVSVTYFNMRDKPKSQWPTTSRCFK